MEVRERPSTCSSSKGCFRYANNPNSPSHKVVPLFPSSINLPMPDLLTLRRSKFSWYHTIGCKRCCQHDPRCLVCSNLAKSITCMLSLSSCGDQDSASRSNPSPMWIHDVFLSFCVNDSAAKSFASLLYTALTEAGGVNVFSVDNGDDLRSGDQITPSALHAIGVSRISIIVFSRNYAASNWCMQELEKIMECRRTMCQTVLPVFYEVDPSNVSQRRGEFGVAFEDFIQSILAEEDKLMSWRAALSEASKILGFESVDSRDPSEDIKKVVEHVTGLLNNKGLFVADHPVGVESRMQDVIGLFMNHHQPEKNPLLLGIWGMAGIGKTTTAKAVYNQIGGDFEAKSFLLNVSEVAKQHNGLVSLQQKLLTDIHKTTKTKIDTVDSGKAVLRERLQDRKILVVIDGVNEPELLSALCGSREWFGAGSMIIITTRDKGLLMRHGDGVDHVYRMSELDQSESLELFSWHAFEQASPKKDFDEHSRELVSYYGGLPLALQVIGSFLFGRITSEWKSSLLSQKVKRIPTIPELEIFLKMYLADLDDTQKLVFLDIACFYVGMDREEVMKIYASSAEVAMQVLQDKSLVTIGEDNKLGMHVLLQQIGREINRVESQQVAQEKIYDVFLSFRGDCRADIVSFLYDFLQNAGIHVFKDDVEIRRGDKISVSLLRAIRKSRICIVVLSKNYANSKWCMLELENIMKYRRTTDMVVVPVFYEVHTSDVRRQENEFGNAFGDLITRASVDKVMVKNWTAALLEVGGIAGVSIINSKNKSDDIKKVVKDVTRFLGKTELFVAEHPVGVESRVQDVIQLLNSHQSNDLLLLGIWGMGGLGKTTIAKAVYNQFGLDYEAKSFLLNVREVCKQHSGLVSLQQQLLSDIFKTTNFKIDTTEAGKVELKKRLSQIKIFLVLDDVNEKEQLDALCGCCKWFGGGSRIIITTRDDDLLSNLDVNHRYKMKEMEKNECIELFSWHAFKQESPREDFADPSSKVVEYCEGLPLALQVMGSYLKGKSKKVWMSALEKLEFIPRDRIQKKLRISFDGLCDHTVQELFLDIAFFFIGMDRNEVVGILNECGRFAEDGLDTLIRQSLVTVDNKKKLRMHNLLRDMGRDIVCEKSPDVPEKRSRLWFHKDILDVLSNNIRKTRVQGLTLKLPEKDTPVNLEGKAFKKMNKLRLLQLAGVQLEQVGDYNYLSRDLRWIYWHRFPLKYIPKKFYQGSLVAMDFRYSNLEQVWKNSQMLKMLKFLNLSHSPNLRQTPDFSYLPNLEKLVLKNCTSLSWIYPTIGNLKELVLINLKNCTSLRGLPRSIYKLKSLKTLILSGCSQIDKLEEDMEQMVSLNTLLADKTAITRVPFALVRSKSIEYISLCGYEGFSRDVFPSIRQSWESPTTILSKVKTTSTGLSSLDLLYSVKGLPKLLRLLVKFEVQLNQCLEIFLNTLNTTNCGEIEAITPNTAQVSQNTSALIDSRSQVCRSQVRILGSKNSLKSLLIQMGLDSCVTINLRENILQDMSPTGSGLLPRSKYPDWFTFSSECQYVTFEVPQVDGRFLKTIMCVVRSSSPDNITSAGLTNVSMINYTKKTVQFYKKEELACFNEEEWERAVSNVEPGNNVDMVFAFEKGFEVRNTTVYLIYDEAIDKKIVHYHKPVDMDVVVPHGDENRFGRLFSMIPSLVRDVLTSKPFWLIGLAVILMGYRCFSIQLRRRKPVLRGGMKKINQSFYERWVDAYQQGIYSKYFKFLKVIGQVCKIGRA